MSVVVPVVGDRARCPSAAPADGSPRAARRPRAQAHARRRGRPALDPARPRGTAILRLGEPEAQLLELLDGRHTVGELVARGRVARRAGRPGGAAAAARRPGEHGMLEGIEGAARCRGRAAAAADAARVLLRASGPRVRRGSTARRRTRLVHARRSRRCSPSRSRGSSRSSSRSQGTTRRRSSSRATSGSAGSCSSPAGCSSCAARARARADADSVRAPRRAQRREVHPRVPVRVRRHDRRAVRAPRRRLAVSGSGRSRISSSAARSRSSASRRRARQPVNCAFRSRSSAYTGALFNLNPLLDRDGYHMLVDWLGIPESSTPGA